MIIEANDDYAYGLTLKKKLTRVPDTSSKSVLILMQDCLKVLQDMTKQKEQDIE